jgi:hypothetical protein
MLAMPVNPGIASIAPDELSSVIQANHKWKRKHSFRRRHFRRRHRFHDDDDFGFSFGFGFPFVGFGLGAFHPDCIGWWHRHRTRLHCHGQLVWD